MRIRRFAEAQQELVAGDGDPGAAPVIRSEADPAAGTEPQGLPAVKPVGAVSRLQEASAAKSSKHRAVTDTLLILKSLTPVIRAALLYPGVDASAEQFGQAVGQMSTAAAKLAEQIARESDPLELDSRWARKSMQELSAELISHHWVAAVIARGGVPNSGDEGPDLPVEMFAEAIRRVMDLPVDISGAKDEISLSYQSSVRLSFIKAFAPLAIEVERYAEVVNRRMEERLVDADALCHCVGQLLMDQAVFAADALLDADAAGGDDYRMTLQGCLSHVGGLLQSVWEPTRGDALGSLLDAGDLEAGRRVLQGLAFVHGFPVEDLRARTVSAVQRLVGTTQAAMTLVHGARDPGQRRQG